MLILVDAHTAHHLYHACLQGDLVKGRTVILVSHHVQLCAEGAGYVVALDNGRVQFEGNREEFQASDAIKTLVQSTIANAGDEKEEAAIESLPLRHIKPSAAGTSADPVSASSVEIKEKTPPRKLIEQESRAVGRVARKVWKTYIRASGGTIIISLLFPEAYSAQIMDTGWHSLLYL